MISRCGRTELVNRGLATLAAEKVQAGGKLVAVASIASARRCSTGRKETMRLKLVSVLN